MPFSIRAHNRLEALADACIDGLAAHPLPPLDPELVLVQSRLMAGWFEERMARRLGVAGGLRPVTPRALLALLAGDRPDSDAFGREALRWRLDPLLDRCAGDERFAAPAAWLAAAGPRARLQLLDRLADLFDTYQLLRPDWLAAWEAGRPAADQAHEAWQAELWRALAAPGAGEHAGRRLARLLAAVRGGAPLALPARLTAFAVTGLPPLLVELLAALGGRIPVTLWVLEPTPLYWGDIRSRRELLRARRRQGPAAGLHADEGHPLLASCGRPARAWFNLLQEHTGGGQAWSDDDPPFELADPDAALGVLARLQSDIATLTVRHQPGAEDLRLEPPAVPAPHLPRAAAVDRSLTIHRCHGPLREVEVARDQVALAFRDLPGLRPEDVAVLTPDLDTYAPLVEAVFARRDGFAPLAVRLSDRPAAAADPLCRALLDLLALVPSRCERSRVLALLRQAPAAAALELAEGDLDRLAGWSARAGIRFGRDAAHRGALGLPAVEQGTWRHGLDRLLAGWLAGEAGDGLAGPDGALFPADPAGGGALLGRFAAWAGTLLATLAEWDRPAPPATWAARLAGAFAQGGLLRDDDGAEQARAELGRLAEGELAHGCVRAWPAAAVADLLARAWEAGEGGGAAGGGGVLCAGLKPPRTIPCRVLVLLGFDRDTFPRRGRPAAFDLIAGDARRRPGDRDPREDDRQLFLDALLAVRERLVVTWPGRDPRTNAERPWSSCLDELAATIDRTWRPGPDGRPFSAALVTDQPLQPFARAYVEDRSDLPTASPLAADLAGVGRSADPPFAVAAGAASPVPAAPPDELDLDALEGFWRHPARAWLRQLGVRLPDDEEPADALDQELFLLDALARARLVRALVDERLAGGNLPAPARVAADGLLPPGALAELALRAPADQALALSTALARHAGGGCSGLVETAGCRLAVALPPPAAALWTAGMVQRARELLAAWVRHCARGALGQGGDTVLVGRDALVRLRAWESPAQALAALDDLVAGWRGHRAGAPPLPFAPEASLALWQAQAAGAPENAALAAARAAWERPAGAHDPGHEPSDRWNRLAWRAANPFADPAAAAWAQRIWQPLLARCGEPEALP